MTSERISQYRYRGGDPFVDAGISHAFLVSQLDNLCLTATILRKLLYLMIPFRRTKAHDMSEPIEATKRFLFASDFDQTLQLPRLTARVLAELLGVSEPQPREGGGPGQTTSAGGELAYLIRHDPALQSPSGASISPRRAGACACAAVFLDSSTS